MGSTFTPGRVRRAQWALACLALMLLAGCGFQLRGQTTLPFDTLHVVGNSPLLVELKRNVAAGSHTKMVDQPTDAQAVLQLSLEQREKVIQSLDTNGRVREYQLRYRVGFFVHDGKGNNWIPTSEIALTRDISFNDSQIIRSEEHTSEL